jgi:hypothetical protein
MQTVFKSQPNTSSPGSGRPQSPSIIFIALTLFALAGLLIGFAVGIFTHQHTATANNNKSPISTLPAHPKASATTQAVQAVPLGCPKVIALSAETQLADGTTPYSITEQAMRQIHGPCDPKNTPLQAANITFKLWLIQRIPGGSLLAISGTPQQILTGIANTIAGKVGNQNFPEIPGLTFDATTPQVQQSNAQGQVTWKYTIAPSVPDGKYDLVVLSGWGQYYNWSWVDIDIQKAGDNH